VAEDGEIDLYRNKLKKNDRINIHSYRDLTIWLTKDMFSMLLNFIWLCGEPNFYLVFN